MTKFVSEVWEGDPIALPPTHRSVTPITRGFVLVHFDSLPDHYTSKHTRKQVNPIQHTQSKVRGPKGAVQKRSRCPLFFQLFRHANSRFEQFMQWTMEKRKYIYILKRKDMFRMTELHCQLLTSNSRSCRRNKLQQLAVRVYSSLSNCLTRTIQACSSRVRSSHHVGVLVLQLVQLFALLPQKQDSAVAKKRKCKSKCMCVNS